MTADGVNNNIKKKHCETRSLCADDEEDDEEEKEGEGRVETKHERDCWGHHAPSDVTRKSFASDKD